MFTIGLKYDIIDLQKINYRKEMYMTKPLSSIALVGRGAVGKSILEQLNHLYPHHVIKVYHSQNVNEAFGTKPDLLIYAGVPGQKGYANANPNSDAVVVNEAFDNIKAIAAKKTILISTIDSLAAALGIDARPYGDHRLNLEVRVLAQIPNSYVYQLPALKGKHVVKNAWYDIRHPELENMSDEMIDNLNKHLEYAKLDAVVKRDGDQIIATGKDTSNVRVAKWFATNPYAEFIWLDLDNFVEQMLNHSDVMVSNGMPCLLYSENNYDDEMAIRSVQSIASQVFNEYMYVGHMKHYVKDLFQHYTEYALVAEVMPRQYSLPVGKIGEF